VATLENKLSLEINIRISVRSERASSKGKYERNSSQRAVTVAGAAEF